MGESSIGWLHPPRQAARVPFGTPGRPGYTLNVWIGCSKIDQECKYCYAEREAGRGRLPLFRERNAAGLPVWGNDAPRHIVSEATIKQCLRWNREAEADLDPRLASAYMRIGPLASTAASRPGGTPSLSVVLPRVSTASSRTTTPARPSRWWSTGPSARASRTATGERVRAHGAEVEAYHRARALPTVADVGWW